MYLWFYRHILKLKKYASACSLPLLPMVWKEHFLLLVFPTCLRTPAKKRKYITNANITIVLKEISNYRWLLAYCMYHHEIAVHWCDIAWHWYLALFVYGAFRSMPMLVQCAWTLQNSHSFQIALSDCDPIVDRLTKCAHMHPTTTLLAISCRRGVTVLIRTLPALAPSHVAEILSGSKS